MTKAQIEQQYNVGLLTRGERDRALKAFETDYRTQLTETTINAFGSPHFDADYLHDEIYNKCDTSNGSVLAVLNTIREISELAKTCYTDPMP